MNLSLSLNIFFNVVKTNKQKKVKSLENKDIDLLGYNNNKPTNQKTPNQQQ